MEAKKSKMYQTFDHRRKRLADRATENGIEKIMICDPVNILYLTGVKITPYERFIALILESETQKSSFILPDLEKGRVKNNAIAEKLYGDHEDPFVLAADLLTGCKVLGAEKSGLTVAAAEKINAALKRKLDIPSYRLTDISELITDLRLCKDPDEVEKLQRAGQFSDQILEEIKENIRIGSTEKQITFDIMQAMAQKPDLMIDTFVIQVLCGNRSANPHGNTSDQRIEKGDPVTIDFGVCYANYWSDCSRTFFVGMPHSKMEEIYQCVLQAQTDAIERVRPGIPLRDVDLAARKVIEDGGYGEFFIHRTGHGIGLSIHEAPSVHRNNTTLLKEGMVFTIEPGIYLPGIGGVRIEDNVVVTREGAKVLIHYPKAIADMVLES